MTVDSGRAETYLRDLAESDLRRYRGGAPQQGMLEATARVRAVAAAFTRIEVLDPAVADGVVDDLTTALEIRSDREARTAVAHLRRAHRVPSSAVTRAGPGPVSVTPVGELLELRDGDTDVDVYLVAAIRTPTLACLGTGILSLPKGSLPRRREKRQGLPPQASRLLPGWSLPGVPGNLRALDDAGRSYDLSFSGGGDNTWSTGRFDVRSNPHARWQTLPVSAAWLDVGNDENSVRISLAAGSPAVEVTTTANGLAPGEQFLRIRAEAMFATGSHDVGTDLEALAALVPALRAVGMLPEDSASAGLIAALCHRYAVSRQVIADPPTALPDRWADLLTGSYDSRQEAGGASPPPAAAHLPVAFPETDGVTTVLSGLLTRGRRTTVIGAFFGAIEQGYPEGPCIWLRDDGGLWHVAKPRNWGSGDINVFGASVIPPVAPSVSSVDILVISRTADVRASVPLTWWTS
jgi:hypothetical protein